MNPTTGRRSPWAMAIHCCTAVLLVMASLAVFTLPASAADSLAVSKSASASALVGGTIDYSITADNNGDDDLYNLTYRDVLPVGVTYASGSTSPSNWGEPTIVTDSVTGQQTLIWRNVSDLVVSQSATLRFVANADATTLPVGTVVTNTGDAYANSDPRYVPRFNTDGTARDRFTASGSASDTTTISALRISKSVPVAERELLRGVHDNTPAYELTIENNGEDPAVDVTVTDYLPAQLEFLGCGGVDNSTAPEYPGAPSLTATASTSPCPTPASVTTVENPSGLPAGVYTRVVWNLGDIGSGSTTIRYRAGIPMRENVMPAAGFVATANLDNNTGASTREGSTEASATNRASVTGTYPGEDAEGDENTTTSSSTSESVSIEDLSLTKTANRSTFAAGEIITYSLRVHTSEYATADEVVLTDVLPDGLCPLSSSENFEETGNAECDPVAGSDPTNTDYASVTDNGSAGFTIVFDPITVGSSDDVVVTYQARMLSNYTGTATLTAAGDSFTNRVSLTGVTEPIVAQDPPDTGPVTVGDESSHTLDTSAPKLSKTIGENSTVMDCSAATYVASLDKDVPAALQFNEGSRVCFKIRIDFPERSSTRNARLTDFLPDGVTYESGSWALTAANTLPVGQVSVDETSDPVFTLGAVNGSSRFVGADQVFEVVLSGIVGAPTRSDLDITSNLAKMRWESSSGLANSLRDEAYLGISTPPPLTIDKQVAGPAGTFADSQVVRHGDQVTYRLRVTNDGTAANSNAEPVDAIEVWDLLPAVYSCADVATAVGMTCVDTGVGSRLAWTLNGPLAPGASVDITYTVVVPTTTTVNTTYENTAGVRAYETENNLGTATAHHPKDNIDPSVPTADRDVPAVSDTASVRLPAVTMTKAVSTSVIESGNSASQAVPGETVTYRIRTTIPAGSAVYNGTMTDPLPANLQFVSAEGFFSSTGADPATGALPPGVTVTQAGGTVTTSLGSTYLNSDSTAHVIETVITAIVQPNYSGTGNRRNTATFESTTLPSSTSTAVTPETAAATLRIVQPLLQLEKTASTSSPAPGQSVTYTVTYTGAAGRPPSHDIVVNDCVPAGLTVTSTVSPTLHEAGDGTNGCATGLTRVYKDAGTVMAGDTGTLVYTVTVDPSATGGSEYTNTVAATYSTLSNGTNDSAVEGVLTATASRTVTVPGQTVTKSIDKTTHTIGERVPYTVTSQLPANTTFWNASVIDALPTGMTISSLQTESITCLNADSSACTVPAGTPLTPSGTTVGWFLGDLDPSAQARTVTIRYSILVTDTCTDAASAACNVAGRTRQNSATARWDLTNRTDPTSAGASFDVTSPAATASTTIVEPTLTIDKTVDDTSVAPGQTFDYTVTVANPTTTNGATAHTIVVTDQVPAGIVVDVDSVTASGGTYDSGTRVITWNLSSLGLGASTELTYQAELAPASSLGTAALTNTARIVSYASLPTGGRAYSGPSSTATVTPQFPDLTIDKSRIGADPSYVGTATAFRIVVTSSGGAPAYDVTVSDTLPAGWELTGVPTITTSGGATTPVAPTTFTLAGRLVLGWTGLESAGIAPGSSFTIDYLATPTADALTQTGVGATVNHVNTAHAVALDVDGETGNTEGLFGDVSDTASATIDSADLRIDKSVVGATVAGSPIRWNLVVSNDGPDTAVGPFTVTDQLDENVTNVSASGTGWTCGIAAGEITCTRTGSLAADQAFPTIVVTATLPADLTAGTTITNTADVSGRTYDPQLGNNEDTVDSTTDTEADLGIVKTTTVAPTAGGTASYLLTVTNHGPSVSLGPISVKDTLPSGTTLVSASGTGWDCTDSAECVHEGDLPVGQSTTIVVTASVAPSATGSRTNVATVEGTTSDPVSSNNSSSVTDTVGRTANLSITKSLKGSDPLVSGSTGTYTIVVANDGPATATGVTVTDELPDYLTLVSVDADGWTCDDDVTGFECELDTALDPTGTATLEVTVEVDPDHTGRIENTASVTATEDPDGDTATATNDPEVRTDLRIAKSHTGTVVAGQDVTFTIAVTNDGPSRETDEITVTDLLPDGLGFVSATGDGWTCDADGCVRPDLGAGESSTITLIASVDPSVQPSTLTNRATVTAVHDTNPANDEATDDVIVTTRADLSITKNADAATATAGEDTTWTITVSNDGPSDAADVSVTDLADSGLTVTGLSGTGWTCDVDTRACTRAVLAAGDSATITVTTSVGSTVVSGATLGNAASASASNAETVDDDDTVEIVRSADLSVAKSVGTVVAGTDVTWTLRITNDGPSSATGVSVSDTLPDNVTFVSATAAGWDCTPGATVVCERSATEMLPDTTETITIVGHLSEGAEGEITNSAQVSATTPDPDESNDEDEVTSTPELESDLSITKTHEADVAAIGDDVTFTLTVENAGPSTARNVTVDDLLPEGLTLVAVTGVGDDTWTCDGTCVLDEPLEPHATATLAVRVTVESSAYPSVTNVATVGSDSSDPDESNNRAEDELTVAPLVDLAIEKSAIGDFAVGGTGTYELTVTNNGPTDDPGVVRVEDELPVGLSAVSAAGDGWTCDVSHPVVCELPTLESGASSTIRIFVAIGPEAFTSVTNTASVSSPATDSDTSNNSSTVTTEVAGLSRLRIDKSLADLDGRTATWRIEVTNDGPNSTTDPVVVVDDLPSTLRFVRTEADGWTCAHLGQQVTCTLDEALESGAAASFDLVTTVRVTDEEITNVATVTSGDSTGVSPSSEDVVDVPSDVSDAGDGDDIPDTGGVPFGLLALGIVLIAVGAGALRRRA